MSTIIRRTQIGRITLIILSLILLSGRCTGPYSDGIYKGSSRAFYTSENYYGNIEITIKDGWISKIDFKIIDMNNNEIFDDKYGKHFEGNELYIQQCKNDWKGVQTYPGELLKYQNIDKVDGISGATWSYNLFKYSMIEALKTAKKK